MGTHDVTRRTPVGVILSGVAVIAGVLGTVVTGLVLLRGEYFCETVVGGHWSPDGTGQFAAAQDTPASVMCPDGIAYLLPSVAGGAVAASGALVVALLVLVLVHRLDRVELARGTIRALALYGAVVAVVMLPAIRVGAPVVALVLCCSPWLMQARGRSPRVPLLVVAGFSGIVLALGTRLVLVVPFVILPAVAAVTGLLLLNGERAAEGQENRSMPL